MAKSADRKLLTPWGEKLDKNNVLSEYPRPQFARDSYLNLNGVWQYAILPADQDVTLYDGDILVPFSPESILSGVERTLQPNEKLNYRREFVLPDGFVKDRILLNFGAVDYEASVYINGGLVGNHKGGYLPFSFDITDSVKDGVNEIIVEVLDPSDKGVQATGKQRLKNSGIWYTPTSGIWQTVWIESVPAVYAESIRITPNLENNTVNFKLKTNFDEKGWIKVLDGEKIIAEGEIEKELTLTLNNYECWCPENPKLYDVELTYGKDKVKSYFGMRSFTIQKDELGFKRLCLNGKPYFQNGLLDQGYWSDGLYTPCSDEAMIYDIQTMKDMGFNMLRKHIKVEPLRWYYHCDRLGMLVWQDMIPGGDDPFRARAIMVYPALALGTLIRKAGMCSDGPKNYKLFSRVSEETRQEYYDDMYNMMDTLMNVVSLCMWVPFNEGWAQFDSLKACAMIRAYDPTRFLDHASGWHDQGGPDVRSFHIYFTKYAYPKYNKDDDRPVALTEFGGFSYVVDGHVHNSDTVFGYRIYKTRESLIYHYKKLFEKTIIPHIRQKGLSATVYTQVSDVQDEVNGLLTYDRQFVKIPVEVMKEINEKMKY